MYNDITWYDVPANQCSPRFFNLVVLANFSAYKNKIKLTNNKNVLEF